MQFGDSAEKGICVNVMLSAIFLNTFFFQMWEVNYSRLIAKLSLKATSHGKLKNLQSGKTKNLLNSIFSSGKQIFHGFISPALHCLPLCRPPPHLSKSHLPPRPVNSSCCWLSPQSTHFAELILFLQQFSL